MGDCKAGVISHHRTIEIQISEFLKEEYYESMREKSQLQKGMGCF